MLILEKCTGSNVPCALISFGLGTGEASTTGWAATRVGPQPDAESITNIAARLIARILDFMFPFPLFRLAAPIPASVATLDKGKTNQRLLDAIGGN
jgi:hypothetical protein